jgi:AcrR family transcriptional regulator
MMLNSAPLVEDRRDGPRGHAAQTAGGLRPRSRPAQASKRSGESKAHPRREVGGYQRVLLISAMADVVHERGVEAATVAEIAERAGVSRRAFYDLFGTREESFMAALEMTLASGTKRVADAYQPDAPWVERLRAALHALLSYVDERPKQARLCLDVLNANPATLARRREIMGALTAVVDEGRLESRSAQQLPSVTAEGVVGGMVAVIEARLQTESSGGLADIAGPLMSMLVLPYLGPTVARRELFRPMISPEDSPSEQAGEEAPGPPRTRITYRTLRVLATIDAAPGLSNRAVAAAAGIRDQGQVSKLLSRMESRGLVRNDGLGRLKAGANSWVLTPRGSAVARAVNLADMGEGLEDRLSQDLDDQNDQ